MKWLWLSVLALCAALLGIYIASALRHRNDAEDSIKQVVRAVLIGDFQTLKRFEFGDELSRTGLSVDSYGLYRRELLSGYLSPNTALTILPDKVELTPPRNEYERRMNESIKNRSVTKPMYWVHISRADANGNIKIPVYAVRTSEGWRVSCTEIVGALEHAYSEDLFVRYKHIREAMKRAGIEAICRPSGAWLTVARLEDFLSGRIDSKDLLQLSR